MSKKISVTVLCGGRSTEHSISLRSARAVVAALNPQKYQVSLVYLAPTGSWYYLEQAKLCLQQQAAADLLSVSQMMRMGFRFDASAQLYLFDRPEQVIAVDCFFSLLHGTGGEDGSVQGLLQVLGAAFVGSSVLSSALCIDKAMTKTVLSAYHMPVVPWQLLNVSQVNDNTFAQLSAQLGLPLIIKPNSLGSSVAMALVDSRDDFYQALATAFHYDEQVLVERYVCGRELECAVLGDEEKVETTLPAELILQKDYSFYSFDAKYKDADAVKFRIPADLPTDIVANIRDLSAKAFRYLRCSGMLRVDFFIATDNTLYINEVNTIPGFTDISLYPKMWQAQGKSYANLLDELIQLGLQAHQKQQQYQRSL